MRRILTPTSASPPPRLGVTAENLNAHPSGFPLNPFLNCLRAKYDVRRRKRNGISKQTAYLLRKFYEEVKSLHYMFPASHPGKVYCVHWQKPFSKEGIAE